MNGQEVKDSRDLAKKIAAIKPGDSAKLGILHDGSQKTVPVTIAKMADEKLAQNGPSGGSSQGAAPFGLTLAPVGTVAGKGSRGVVVANVNPDGPAAEHGIRSGDLILDVSGKAVNTPAEVREAINEARSSHKQTVLMRIKSGDATHFVAVPVATG